MNYNRYLRNQSSYLKYNYIYLIFLTAKIFDDFNIYFIIRRCKDSCKGLLIIAHSMI
jgi:hypothetical protein